MNNYPPGCTPAQHDRAWGTMSPIEEQEARQSAKEKAEAEIEAALYTRAEPCDCDFLETLLVECPQTIIRLALSSTYMSHYLGADYPDSGSIQDASRLTDVIDEWRERFVRDAA